MGQKFGKCILNPAAEPFANLPRKAIAHLWQVFNDIADGFGVSVDEVVEICADLKDELNVSRLSMIEKSTLLFELLDTDKNGLIDALEFMSTLAALSGMRLHEIIDFILTSYDFDGTSELSVDEVTLALKSVTTGLCKVCLVKPPREELVEQLVSTMYSEMTGEEANDSMKVRVNVIVEVLSGHPDARSWFAYFGNTPQAGLQNYDLTLVDKDFDRENISVLRHEDEKKAIDWDLRCKAELKDQIQFQIGVPWLSAVAMLTPLEYSNQTMRRTAPDATLAPEWIYGYQAEKCRNNIRYNFQGNCVYNIGKYMVVYSFNGHSQLVFAGHHEEITCMSMHPEGQLVASGEAGPRPRVIIWHTVTREVHFQDRDFHRDGIACIAFSCDGKMLASVGNDLLHRLCVHRWADKQCVFTSNVSEGPALTVAFLLDGTVAVGGDAFLYFWSTAPEGIIKRRANFSRYAPVQPITALTSIGSSDNMVAGTASGQLFMFTDRNCVRNIKAHEGTVNALHSSPHGVLSAGRDHRVRLWTTKLEPGATFDMSSFGFNPSIRSACLSADGACILVGTKGSNIFEVSSIDGSDVRGGPVVSGHSWGKLNCLATHPSKHEFLTVGDDKRLRVWDMATKSQLKIATFDADILCVAYSPVGDQITVGLGGDPSLAKCGAYVVLNEEDMGVIHEARDSATAICLVKYSPEGETLAVGAKDGAIYLYAVLDEFELIGRCVRHTQPVTNLDFSADGEWIRTNSMEQDICFFNSDDASLQSNLPAMRDVVWNSWSCVYNWHTKGAHRTAFKGERIVSLHAPNPTPTFVAIGTNYGYVRLNYFPCVTEDAACHRFPAHAGEIAEVRFSFDEKTLLSAGAVDRCVVQWKVIPHAADPDVNLLDLPESDDYRLEVREGSDLEEDFMTKGADAMDGVLNATKKTDPKNLLSTPAVDAWFESVVAPTHPPTQHTSIPDMSVRLEYCYGYTSQGIRGNVRYTQDGNIVYTASTLGVVLSRTTRAQSFFQRHTDKVTSFATTRDGAIAATGQMGHKAFVAVWDTKTCVTLATIPDIHANAVSCLSFSNNGKLLVTVALDEDHIISVYEWSSGSLVSRMYGGTSHIFSVCFSSTDLGLLTVGVKDIKIWSGIMHHTPTMISPPLGAVGNMQPFLCCAYFTGAPLVGTLDGNLYLFENNVLKTAVKAHDGSVSCIDVDRAGTFVVTGGKDGAVRIWNVHLECTKEITMMSVLPSTPNGAVKSVAFSADANNLIIGTRGAEIFEVAVRSGQIVGKPLLSGHGTRELWGLATHPTKNEFVTSGDDATIRVWDARSFQVTKCITVDTATRAICYSPDGKYIAIGFGFGKRVKGKGALKEGAFTILQSNDLKMAHEGKDSNEPIRVVKFTPDSLFLAVGSEDSSIYIYNVKDFFSKKCTIAVHKAPVMYLDFTADGKYLMSVDSTNRISFSEVATGMHIPSPVTLREEKWATWSAPVGWPVQGMWICMPEGVRPVSMQRSWGGIMLAAGTSAGKLVLTHNPCPARAGYVGSAGHAGPISQVSWLAGDGTIMTTGAKDQCIFQWKCVFDQIKESGDEKDASGNDSEIERDGGHEVKDNHVVRAADNFGKIPPWTLAIAPPSDLVPDDQRAPHVRPVADFCHGIRTTDCRQNICYNEDGHHVYASTNYGVVYDRDAQEQRIYEGHKSAVISLTVNSTGRVAASGDLHETPELHLWDARTARYLGHFEGLHKRGITSLSFSESGSLLVTLGQDVMHSIVVLRSPTKNWHDGYVYCSTSVSPRKMLFCKYFESNNYPIVVGGQGQVIFFRPQGRTLERVRGVFGKQKKIQPMMCCVQGEPIESADGAGQSAVITGAASGHMYVWHGSKVAYTVTGHEAPIYAIAKLNGGYASAGRDGAIKLWSSKMQLVHNYNSGTFKPSPYTTTAHSLCANLKSTRISVGLRGGELYEISLPTHSTQLLMEGHSYLELHALDTSPVNSDEYVTVGDDGILRIWSYRLRTCLRRVNVEAACRAVRYSPDGTKMIVGLGGDPSQATKDGAFMVINVSNLEIILEDRKAKLYLTEIKFHPLGETIAMVSADGKCYIHDASNYAFVSSITMPVPLGTKIMHIDWSESGSYLRLSSDKDELFHFKATGDLITAPLDVRDVEWNTYDCPFTWKTAGYWRQSSDNINVIAVSLDYTQKQAAVSYQNGDVRLYRFPCQQANAKYVKISGISTQAHRMRFSCDSRYLVAMDAYTRTVVQYALKPNIPQLSEYEKNAMSYQKKKDEKAGKGNGAALVITEATGSEETKK